jgi:hypothetical protein
MSHNWQVVAGEESTEVEAQKLREMRVLEAVYPRLSAIPPRLIFHLITASVFCICSYPLFSRYYRTYFTHFSQLVKVAN